MIRLKELRQKRHISQVKLAMDLNMNQNSISRYETGEREADYETLIAFADYFGVSVDYLLNEETKKFPAVAEDKITFDDFTYAMYNHSADLTEEEKKMLLEMAEFMKKKRGL